MRYLCLLLALYVLVIVDGVRPIFGQAAVPRVNKNFIVDRARVLPFDTAIEFIGPFVADVSLGPETARWTKLITVPSVFEAVSIHVTIGSASVSARWELRFEASNTVKDVITSESERGKAKNAWSLMIPGNSVVVKLFAEEPPRGLAISIDQYSHPIDPSVPQGIIGKNYLQSILGTATDIRRVGEAVARLRISTDRGEALCTGFLVSASLLITNYHCIQTNTEAANTQVDFGYDGSGTEFQTYRLQRLEVINSDIAFDYVVARVSGEPGQVFRPLAITSAGRVSFEGISNNLLVVEHPGGGPKQVSIRNCSEVTDRVAGVDPATLSDFSHKCNTLGGSSGSPVLSLDTKEVVGLHHLGDAEANTPGATLVNQAVYIGYILKDIQRQNPAIIREIVPQSP